MLRTICSSHIAAVAVAVALILGRLEILLILDSLIKMAEVICKCVNYPHMALSYNLYYYTAPFLM